MAAPTPATLPLYIGAEKGFFAEEGFETSYVTVSSGAAMVPALTAGQTDLITASLTTLIGMRQGGSDIRIVSGYTQGQNYFVYVRKGVGVPASGTFEEKMKALNGLRIGAQGGADGNVVAYLKAVMTAGGGDPSTLQFANLAFGGPQIAALQSDQIDAVLADDSTVVTADQLGLGASAYSLLNDPPAQFQGMLGSGVGVMGSSLAQHPNFGERLFRAMTKTYAWMKDPTNQQEMVKIATGTQGLPQTADLGSRLKVLAGQMTASNDRALLQRTLDFLYDTRQVKPEPRVTVDQFFDQVMVSGT